MSASCVLRPHDSSLSADLGSLCYMNAGLAAFDGFLLTLGFALIIATPKVFTTYGPNNIGPMAAFLGVILARSGAGLLVYGLTTGHSGSS